MSIMDLVNMTSEATGFATVDPLPFADPSYNTSMTDKVCSTLGNRTCFEEWSYYRFQNPGLGPDLVTLAVNGLIFLSIVALIEKGAWRYCV